MGNRSLRGNSAQEDSDVIARPILLGGGGGGKKGGGARLGEKGGGRRGGRGEVGRERGRRGRGGGGERGGGGGGGGGGNNVAEPTCEKKRLEGSECTLDMTWFNEHSRSYPGG